LPLLLCSGFFICFHLPWIPPHRGYSWMGDGRWGFGFYCPNLTDPGAYGALWDNQHFLFALLRTR